EKMSYKLFGACTLLLAALFVSIPVFAQNPEPTVYSATDAVDIKRVEAYLNNVRTLKARFVQVTSSGGYSEGELFISRPGKMRIEYKPPVPVLIIADGQWLIYNDKELEQVNYVDLKSTPAGVLVADKVSFTNGDYQVGKIQRRANTLRMLITKTADKAEGAVTLIFSDSPLVLKKWAITDAQGVQTTISLLGTRFGIPLDPDLFKFDDPDNEIFREDS
ncbi:MAG: outer membrane lipoprotein carrier protein LolA, partial [Gemmatimonadetes bacterium]|nr:outer membrane lipoprotein carrier protein LolA [Gemmatimonadota bacterium]